MAVRLAMSLSSVSRTPTHQYQGVNPTPRMSRFGTRNCRNHPWCTISLHIHYIYTIIYMYIYIYIISIDKHFYSIVFVLVLIFMVFLIEIPSPPLENPRFFVPRFAFWSCWSCRKSCSRSNSSVRRPSSSVRRQRKSWRAPRSRAPFGGSGVAGGGYNGDLY